MKDPSIFIQILHGIPTYLQGMQDLETGQSPIVYHEMGDASKAHVVYGLVEDLERHALVVTHSDDQAKKIYGDLSYFLGQKVGYLPAEPTLFYFVEAYSPEISIERLRILRALEAGEKKVLVVSIQALMKKLPPKDEFSEGWKSFEVGQIIGMEEFQDCLIQNGYERVEEVESPGQYNVRGGIVDVYPMAQESPYRVEFFDDEIDSIRSFDPLSQRSIDKVERFTLSPTREAFNGPSSYDSLLEYFPQDPLIFLDQPHRIKEKYDGVVLEFQEDFKGLLEKGEVKPDQWDVFFDYHTLTQGMEQKDLCIFQALLRRSDPFRPKRIYSFTSRSMHPFHGKLELLADEIKQWRRRNYSVIILAQSEGKAKKLVDELTNLQIPAVFSKDFYREIHGGEVLVLEGSLDRGVDYPDARAAIISDQEIFAQDRRRDRTPKRKRERRIQSFVELNIGDYVVHENHGIGIYLGLEKIQVEGVQRDYLNIKYAQGDRLFIPTDQMHLIQPYIGAENRPPKLNKLGGSEWKRAKGRVKKAIEDMTQELIELYAQRQSIQGFAFSKDTPWQRQFEEGFPFEETQDQLKAVEEIKRDMERPIAMDRLLCGDVGYGKTEVALRAAFKAVMDGKQVAILVPTTILAQQHYNTMNERFSGFPIGIGILSRFRTAAEQQQTLKDIRNGMVDIVVGTHRILQRDIQFKDLGLLIIDEEQRFGVGHKERLKQWKKNVDVLTLSATPIPRTLHMSLVGIRDMSIIEQPPEERYPVQTYVMEYNETLIRDAILREMDRGGQVYYVYNRVEDIERRAHDLKALVPEARIAIGHGQMSEHSLENTMVNFVEGQYDVLVCTTIIETGLDMPNVNTLIVTNADAMGLSQLYQLRGRVGRSSRLAYAYITYEKDRVLTEVAEKRLHAIKEFTEFGSGFKIALRDLEIRGAGNLLGAEQHGHMASVGYDLYCKMLEEAVHRAKGIPQKIQRETTLELQVDAFIPNWYIPKESQRIQMYKKMMGIQGMGELYDLQEEIEDRFGDLPNSVNNLLMISLIRSMAQELKIHLIKQKKKWVYFYMEKEDFIPMETIGPLIKEYGRNIMINASEEPYIALTLPPLVDQHLMKIRELLEKIKVLQV